MNDNEFFELLKMRLQECRDIQNSEAIPSIKAMARKKVIDALTVEHSDNWQCVATPYDIINEMCDLVKEAEHYIVFFSLEFLEVMIKERGISPDKIFFIADNIAESQVASHSSMYGVKSIVFSKNDVNLSKNHSDLLYMCINKIGDFMNFNKLAVIGNPPYNINSNGKDSVPIYHTFVENVIDNMKPDFFTFIIPSRWQVGGKGLDKHRERMMNDKHMKKIVHFPGSFSVFPTVEIAGGVSYFAWDKNHNDDCEYVVDGTTKHRNLNEFDIIIQDNVQYDIVKKTEAIATAKVIQKVFSQKPFGLRSDFKDWSSSGIKCVSVDKQEHFVTTGVFTDKNNILNKYKVIIGKANNDTNPSQFRVLAKPTILAPNEICTETYLVINTFDSKQEAENFAKYVITKFFRFMVLAHKNTQNMAVDTFMFVPDMVDYSTPWTDAELYKKFNLTRQEIAYIESKIKAI